MSSEKLDWIYKGISGLVDREDYLTGRKIDKTFQLLEQQEKGQKGDLDVDTSIPPSIFTNNDVGSVDLINKMREDPLYKMKKRQAEESKKILQNPIKMKKLKSLLESTIKQSDSRKKKKKKKYSKLKRDSSSSDDNCKGKIKHRHEKTSISSSSSTSSSFKVTPEKRKRNRGKTSKNRIKSQSSYSVSSTFPTSSSNHSKPHHSSHKSSFSSNSNSFTYRNKPNRRQDGSKQRLSGEQLEKKRQEMLEAGSWREKQRKSNVEQYKKEEEFRNSLRYDKTSDKYISKEGKVLTSLL